MEVQVGSTNPTKINAVKRVFSDANIIGKNVSSHVSEQPFSDEETRLGAINRAKQCVDVSKRVLGIGLEGGVMYLENQLYLCNWGALVTPENLLFTASGARIPLPEDIAEGLQAGKELGDIIDEYVSKRDIRKKEGTIGIFTNQLITRSDLFTHVVKLLRGQWEYSKKVNAQ